MHSLTTIAKMNQLTEIAKEQFRAKRLNRGKHPKKGQNDTLDKKRKF